MKLHFTVKNIFKVIKYKRIVCILLCLLMIFTISGCKRETEKVISVENNSSSFCTEPCLKDNQKPYCIALLDEGPPIASSYLWLKGMVEQFQSMGYINDKIDFSKAPRDYEGLYNYLLNENLGPYIKFDEKAYFIEDSNENELEKELKNRIENGQIDIIAATGTAPGVFLKKIDPDVPFLVSFASDPVGAGIIDSAEDTGDKDIWALVEPNPMGRQFKVYHKMFGFKKVGVLFLEEYEEIAGITTYEDTAKDLNVELIKSTVTADEIENPDYVNILKSKVREMAELGIDAFILSIAVVPDDNAEIFASILEENRIPYLISDGEELVESGGMISISCFDYEGYGQMASMVMSNVFHGQNAGDQVCTYVSSPILSVNLATAKKSDFKMNFSFIQSIDHAYRNED